MSFLFKKIVLFSMSLFVFFLFFSIIELSLPIDFFNFRVWESLVVRSLPRVSIGPFYPNKNVKKQEVGEFGAHSVFALKKNVEWQTDSFGYRFSGVITSTFDIVVIGDSNITGSALSQSEMFSSVLGNLIHRTVYPLAPANINNFIQDKRFVDHQPTMIILSAIERTIFDLPAIVEQGGKKYKIKIFLEKVIKHPKLSPIMFLLDRITKFSIINRVRSLFAPLYGQSLGEPINGNLYLRDWTSLNSMNESLYAQSLSILESYNKYFKQRNIKFIFLPIPNKETIYYKDFGKERPLFLSRLIADLSDRDVAVVNTVFAFQKVYDEKNTPLYFSDDSHWNANGVNLVASLVKEQLDKMIRKE